MYACNSLYVQLSVPPEGFLRSRGPRPRHCGLYALFTLAGDSDFLRQVAGLDISLTQLKLLSHLHELPKPVEGEEPERLSVKQVAEQLGISLPAASRALDPLVKRRLVARHEDAVDRRVKRVRLTTKGEAAVGR